MAFVDDKHPSDVRVRRLVGRRSPLLLAALLMILPGCSLWGNPMHRGDTQRGLASWYGPGFHGKQAANGEIYNQDALTAAHKTLPFETLVEVKRRDTGAKVTVRITDRGPFVRGRIIDLSREAARRIDAIGPGVVPVRLRILGVRTDRADRPGAGHSAHGYTIQLGRFQDPLGAADLHRRLVVRIPGLRILTADSGPGVRLVTRNYPSYGRAARIAHKIRRDLRPGAFVIPEPDAGEPAR